MLEREGYTVRCFDTGDALLEKCSHGLPDMVLSVKNSPYDRITALSLGCDDYLAKPFHPLELTLRIGAILRRYQKEKDTPRENRLEYGPLALLPGQKLRLNNGNTISLAPGEYNFLAYLIKRPGQSATRGDLLRDLWHTDEESARNVDYLVKRLRKKLSEADAGLMIETVWGYGFRLALKE